MKVLMVLALMSTFVVPAYTRAALVITKVVANPPGANAGRQWIQITNTGTTSIDLGTKNIRLFTMSGNHLIKAYASGGTVVSAGEIAVIAENPMSFLVDWPSYTGMLFKSSFTLPAAGVVGVVQTDGTVLARKSYVSVPTPSAFGKPASVSKSTTKRGTTRTTSVSSKSVVKTKKNSYGNGTIAPAAAANAAAAGAVFALPSALAPLASTFIPLLGSIWFTLYLALITFSGFSLIVIQRHYYL